MWWCYWSIIVCGDSKIAFISSTNLKAASRSTERPSADSVTVISFLKLDCEISDTIESNVRLKVCYTYSGPLGEKEVSTPPTAKIPACGGLITAVNSVIPNIPKFDTLKYELVEILSIIYKL